MSTVAISVLSVMLYSAIEHGIEAYLQTPETPKTTVCLEEQRISVPDKDMLSKEVPDEDDKKTTESEPKPQTKEKPQRLQCECVPTTLAQQKKTERKAEKSHPHAPIQSHQNTSPLKSVWDISTDPRKFEMNTKPAQKRIYLSPNKEPRW